MSHKTWLEQGDTGPAVGAWQRIVGVSYTKVDRNFGPGTKAKVIAWQTKRGIEPDGVLGRLCRLDVRPGDLIKPYEGCVLQTYDDASDGPLSSRLLHRVGGYWFRPDGSPCRRNPTIGWGDTAAPRRGVERCTQAEADLWFDQRLARTDQPAALKHITLARGREVAGVTGDAAQIAAACTFSYNCGTGALGNLATAGFSQEKWMQYVNFEGHVNVGLKMRREEEYALWSFGAVWS